MMVKILITTIIVAVMLTIIEWMISRLKSKSLLDISAVEKQERKMKSDKREELAKKFMIVAGLRNHWKELHVRKYTDIIVNSEDKHANTLPCRKGGKFYMVAYSMRQEPGCEFSCPIAEYFGANDCDKLKDMVLFNPPSGQALADEVLDEIEMYLKSKYADIIKPERERDNLDKIFEGLEVDWDKEDA